MSEDLRWAARGWQLATWRSASIATQLSRPMSFTLRDQNYPARFDVEDPRQLARGLVGKWWLVAISHTNCWSVCSPAGLSVG